MCGAYQGHCVQTAASEGYRMREKGLHTLGCRESAGVLLEKCEGYLARKIVTVDWMGYWGRHEGSEQMVEAFGAENFW